MLIRKLNKYRKINDINELVNDSLKVALDFTYKGA
jgi:hypothetical protein